MTISSATLCSPHNNQRHNAKKFTTPTLSQQKIHWEQYRKGSLQKQRRNKITTRVIKQRKNKYKKLYKKENITELKVNPL